MAKEALLGVLQSTIGRYVLDLDAEKLNLGIWSGKVELHDLKLDVNACNGELDQQAKDAPNLAIPLKVVDGKFTSILLEIPWTHLTDRSVVMKAKGLHIHVAPYDRFETVSGSSSSSSSHSLVVANKGGKEQEQETTALKKQQQKRAQSIVSSDQKRLQRKELMKLTELSGGDGEDDDDDDHNYSGFVGRLVKRIVENLQIEINDVKVTLEGTEGTAGMSLDAINFVTTDMAGHRTFVDRTAGSTTNPSDLLNKFLYKKLQIKGLGLFLEKEEESSSSSSSSSSSHKYILDPLDFEATVREADASITKEYPKWLLKSKMSSVQLGLSQKQYQQAMGILHSMSTATSHQMVPLFPEYRPLTRPKSSSQNAKDWWQYAYRCVGRLTGRSSWRNFFQAFKARKKYVQLYKRKVYAAGAAATTTSSKTTVPKTAKWLKRLSIEEEAELNRLEADRCITVDAIMIWRNLADAQVEKERAKQQEYQNKKEEEAKRKGGMLYHLFGSSGSSNEEKNPIIELSAEELRELENVGLEEVEKDAGGGGANTGEEEELSCDAKLCRIEFVLGEFKIHLTKGFDDQPLMGLDMGRVDATFNALQGGCWDFVYSLESLEILDHLHSSSLFPRIVRSLPQDGPGQEKEKDKEEEEQRVVKSPPKRSEEDVFQVHMSKSKKGDKKLIVKLITFEAVFAPHLMTEMMNFIRVPGLPEQQASAPPAASSLQIDEIEETMDVNDVIAKKETNGSSTISSENFSNALFDAWREKTKEKTSLSIDLDLQAPILVLPENCSDPKASVIVLDLGGFRLKTGIISDASPKVTKWLADNPRDASMLENQTAGTSNVGTVVDLGTLELEKMTFLVGEAETWRRVSCMRENDTVGQESIIEPITLRFDFAVESVITSSIPRACVFTSVAASKFKFSPNHLLMALRVYNAWMNASESIRGEDVNDTARAQSYKPLLEDKKRSSSIFSSQKKRKSRLERTAENADSDNTKGEFVQAEVDQVSKDLSSIFADKRDISLFTTVYFEMTSDKYSCVIYDSGEFQKTSTPQDNIAEGLALEGGMHFSLALATDKRGSTSSTSVRVEGQQFEIYSGFGRELRRPLQMLEPVTGALKLRLLSRGPKAKQTDVNAKCHEGIDLTFSMRNMALIIAISTELSQCLKEGLMRQDVKAGQLEILDDETTQQIEALSSALESDTGKTVVSLQPIGEEYDDSATEGIDKKKASMSMVTLNLKIPKSKCTIINDLQGLDEALFRIELDQYITKGTLASMTDADDSNNLAQTSFDFKQHAIILADYYDPSVNSWMPLLKNPWQLEFKAARKPDTNSKSGRFNTRSDIHLWPLHFCFSEQFLIGLGSASRMLSMSAEIERENEIKLGHDKSFRASTTRNLVAALPYALDNFSGVDVEYLLAESRVGNRSCPNGKKCFFRYNPPQGRGHGGKRVYGEDVTQDLSIKIFIGETDTIEIQRIDDELGKPKRCHILKDGTAMVTTVVKEGLSTVVRLSSNMYMRNRTPMATLISIVKQPGDCFDIGLCEPTSSLLDKPKSRLVPYDVKDGTLSKKSLRLGIRFPGQSELVKKWGSEGKGRLEMKISPMIEGCHAELHGTLVLEADIKDISEAENNTIYSRVDVVCTSRTTSSEPEEQRHDFVLQAAVKMQLIQGKRVVTYISLEPRAMLVSTIPVRVTALTRLPYCYSVDNFDKPERSDTSNRDGIHELMPGSKIEVYSGGEFVFVKLRITDTPHNGTPTQMSRQWIHVPLSSPLKRPILCLLPFVAPDDEGVSPASPGSEFFIAEATPTLPSFFLERINDDGKLDQPTGVMQSTKPPSKTLLFTVGNYGVDHTRSILFEQLVGKSKGFFDFSISKEPCPFGAFPVEGSKHRISLLPTSEIPIRLLLPGSTGARRTALFRVEEVSMSTGGAQATPLLWDDGSQSGYFAYRKLVSSFQSELHVIPEFLVFNGSSKHQVVVKQQGAAADVTIAPGKAAPVFAIDHNKGLPLSFHYEGIGGATKELGLHELGLHIELVQTTDGHSLGSLAIQTSIGSDSRLQIKLGEVGQIEQEKDISPVALLLPSWAGNDTLRFRIHAEEFALTLNQALSLASGNDGRGTLEKASSLPEAASKSPQVSSDTAASERPTLKSMSNRRVEKSICTIRMKRVIYDVQKLYKEKEELANEDDAPERCQLSLIVHDFAIRDETPRSPFPDVFHYTGESRFFDLCVRTKGPLHDRNVKVDLFDFVLAHSGKGDDQSQDKMFLQTSENFVWKLIDTADLISEASKEPTDKSDFDEALAAYVPPSYANHKPAKYAPPQVATIYTIQKARVSPFNIIVSFRRNPEASRYEKFINSESAHLMRYFTQQLKFTIDNCDLRFARYEETSLNGPRDRLIEILTAVYVSRMKLKVVTILAAATFGDWKDLAARDDGDDEFVDGDLLRVTGSVAGNSVAFAFNKVGRDLGSSVTMGVGAIGDGIENGAALLGARGLGSGVNAVLSGAGGLVGGTLQGVGEGAGALFKGAGEGLGHFFGGITGGGSRIVKGVGKSITTGDGGALVTGFTEGLEHVGSGVTNTVKAVGTGVHGSVANVVRGSVAGVRESQNRSSAQSHASDLAKLREEFRDQDYS